MPLVHCDYYITRTFLPAFSQHRQLYEASILNTKDYIVLFYTKHEVKPPDAGYHHTKGELAFSSYTFQHSDTSLSAVTTKYSRDPAPKNCQTFQGKNNYKTV